MSNSTSGTRVLVSGANGAIASVIVHTFLDAGYTVRGTVRTQTKGDSLKAYFSEELASRLEIVVVPDITVEGAFDEAVKGVDYFLHAASPLPKTSQWDNETDVLIPAINGTLTALHSAVKEPQIKKVVMLSSIAAVRDSNKPTQIGVTYDETSWNTLTYDIAKSGPTFVAYMASKVLAEKAAWDFVKTHNPSFHLVTLNPTFVYGKPSMPIDPEEPFTGTNKYVSDLLLNPNFDLTTAQGGAYFVDVRDVARAHLLAIENPSANNRRFILSSHKTYPSDYITILAKSLPAYAPNLPKIPDGWTNAETYALDRSASEDVLGLVYHTEEETLGDTARWILEIAGKL